MRPHLAVDLDFTSHAERAVNQRRERNGLIGRFRFPFSDVNKTMKSFASFSSVPDWQRWDVDRKETSDKYWRTWTQSDSRGHLPKFEGCRPLRKGHGEHNRSGDGRQLQPESNELYKSILSWWRKLASADKQQSIISRWTNLGLTTYEDGLVNISIVKGCWRWKGKFRAAAPSSAPHSLLSLELRTTQDVSKWVVNWKAMSSRSGCGPQTKLTQNLGQLHRNTYENLHGIDKRNSW